MSDPRHPSMEEYSGLPVPGTHCQVLFCGREDCLPANRVESRRDECLFHLVTSGRGRVSHGPDHHLMRDLGPGQGFFFMPGQQCIYRPDPVQPWSYRWIGFNATDLDALLGGIGVDRANPLVTLSDPRTAEDILRRILELLRDRPPQAGLVASSLLLSLLAELARGSTGTPILPERRSPTDIAKDYIQTRYHRGITVQDVADHVGFDSSYLLKLFRRETGGNMRDYLIRTRLERARMLLRDPSISVSEAALSVGFRSYSSFEKTFRIHCGTTPTAYRESLFF